MKESEWVAGSDYSFPPMDQERDIRVKRNEKEEENGEEREKLGLLFCLLFLCVLFSPFSFSVCAELSHWWISII